MALIRSKITAQGQISVPAEIRRRLGLRPGSIIEWDEAGGNVIVRRTGRTTSEELHRILFQEAPEPASTADIKRAIRDHVNKRHASR